MAMACRLALKRRCAATVAKLRQVRVGRLVYEQVGIPAEWLDKRSVAAIAQHDDLATTPRLAEHLAAELGPRFEPPELLRTMVADGNLGKKTGRGFHEWS